METRAPYIIVGAFVLAAIAAVFGFVYWLNNAGGIGKRDIYQLVFNGPVPGLLVGAGPLGRDKLQALLEADFDAVMEQERRWAGDPVLADAGKQLLVTGKRPG